MRLMIGLVLGMLGMALGLSAGCGGSRIGDGQGPQEEALAEAVACLERGDPEEALPLLTDLVARMPSNAVARLNLGIAHEQSGSLLEAVDAYKEAAALDPGVARALELAARIHMQVADWDGARRLLDQANRREGASPRILTTMGVVEYRAGNLDMAGAFFDAAIKADPSYASAHYNAAVLQRDAHQDVARAVAFFQAYLDVADEDDSRLADVRAYVAAHQDMSDDPQSGAVQAVAPPPAPATEREPAPEPSPDLARAEPAASAPAGNPAEDNPPAFPGTEQGEPSPAVKPVPADAPAAAQQGPAAAADVDTSANRLWTRALNAHHQQDTGRAVELYKAALELDPKLFGAWHNLGLAARREGDLATAQQAFEQALELRPEWTDSTFMLAVVLHERGDDEAAAKRLDTLLSTQPRHVRAHYLLAVIYAHAGRRGMARTHFETVLRLDGTGEYGLQARTWLESNERRPPPRPER